MAERKRRFLPFADVKDLQRVTIHVGEIYASQQPSVVQQPPVVQHPSVMQAPPFADPREPETFVGADIRSGVALPCERRQERWHVRPVGGAAFWLGDDEGDVRRGGDRGPPASLAQPESCADEGRLLRDTPLGRDRTD